MRMQRCVVIAVTFLATAATAQPAGWQRYVVSETGASVDVPVTVFSEQAGTPETGFGQRFLTSDRRANLTIQSVLNEGYSPATFLAKKNPPAGIIYKRITNRFFVVSSVRDDKIWYNRCNFSGRFANCILINYPTAEKRSWDGIVTRISNSLASR